MKVLCFTTSYNRPKMLRSCIQDINNQTYPNIHHAVNVAFDVKKQDYTSVIEDINSNLTVIYNKNAHQQINHMNAIKAVDYTDFDLFIKIDDDDIYKSDYVENVVQCFNKTKADVSSSFINEQLNGHTIYRGSYDNLGNKPEHLDFHMPMTLAFNRKALELIIDLTDLYHYEDMMWRDEWTKAGLIHATALNQKSVIWYIHGANISTASFLRPET